MKPIQFDTALVSKCGLYCGACSKYLKGKCPGCQRNEKATWCKVRSCCLENSFASCADCRTVSDPTDCKDFNNFIARLFGLIFRSDRRAGIEYIRQQGLESFARHMAGNRQVAIKK